MLEVTDFYDDLSAHYHLLLADWDAAVAEQGRALDALIAELAGPGPKRVLDATCGIGTQAIGLALRGHRVTGSDLSPAAVARASREAQRFGVALDLRVADLRCLSEAFAERFEVVCALGNALAHLETDADLGSALCALAARLEPGGLLLADTRDYDALRRERPRTTPIGVYDDAEGRRLVFQVWDWDPDGEGYDLTIYVLRHRGTAVEVLTFPGRCRALTRPALTAAIEAAGLAEVRWLEPEETDFYQSIVAARRP